MHVEMSALPVALLNDSFQLCVRPFGHGQSKTKILPRPSDQCFYVTLFGICYEF